MKTPAHLNTDNFAILSVNGGALSKPWEYIRLLDKSVESYGSAHRSYPLLNVYNNHIRCGWGAEKKGKGVKTLTVNAGDVLSYYPVRANDRDQDVSFAIHLASRATISWLIDQK